MSGREKGKRAKILCPDREEEEWLLKEGLTFSLLHNEACLEAESLWRKTFTEDSPSFTDYYFACKALKNRGLVLKGAEGVRAMLYLTPESVRLAGQSAESAYVVGVATDREYRHRGYMAFLLKKAMELLYAQQIPFVFLMPASPDIYTPFGFAWIYDRPLWDAKSLRKEKLTTMTAAQADEMAAFASGFLEREKAVYICRDRSYYIQQEKELASQNGCIYGYREEGNRLAGLCMYIEEDGQPEILEVLAREEAEAQFVKRCKEKKPGIMARIIHAEKMLSFLETGDTAPFVLALKDPAIPGNNGLFLCEPKEGRTKVTRLEDDREADIRMDISQLAAVLFGYETAENAKTAGVTPLFPVWINEIV